jgi:hypothetical protein
MYMVTTKKLKYTDNSILIYMRKSKISLAKKIRKMDYQTSTGYVPDTCN